MQNHAVFFHFEGTWQHTVIPVTSPAGKKSEKGSGRLYGHTQHVAPTGDRALSWEQKQPAAELGKNQGKALKEHWARLPLLLHATSQGNCTSSCLGQNPVPKPDTSK